MIQPFVSRRYGALRLGADCADLVSRILCEGGAQSETTHALDGCCAKPGRQMQAQIRLSLYSPLHARAREPGNAAENDPGNEAGHGGHDDESMCQ